MFKECDVLENVYNDSVVTIKVKEEWDLAMQSMFILLRKINSVIVSLVDYQYEC